MLTILKAYKRIRSWLDEFVEFFRVIGDCVDAMTLMTVCECLRLVQGRCSVTVCSLKAA
jgi:hypothetical protein